MKKRASSGYTSIKTEGAGIGTSSIQEIINESMRKKIPIEAFIKTQLSADSVKNTTATYCPICGSDDVNVTTKQTRSIDEAATNFYKCLRCGFLSKKFLKDDGSAEFKKMIKQKNEEYKRNKK